MFSDDGEGERQVFDDVDELRDYGVTAPPLAAPLAADDAATGRFDLASLDDYDGLPSAHISELDNEVHSGGAPTAIMQLPPEMDEAHANTDTAESNVVAADSVEMMRWSAGQPQNAAEAPKKSSVISTTLPALSVTAVRAASEALHVDAPPPPVAQLGAPPLVEVRRLAEEALAAVQGAQACVRGHPDAILHRQLDRALSALAQLLDETD